MNGINARHTSIGSTPRGWFRALRQLYDHLVTTEDEFNLLRQIDVEAVDLSIPLEATVQEAARRLGEISHARAAHVYVFDGERLLLVGEAPRPDVPSELAPSLLGYDVNEADTWSSKSCRWTAYETTGAFADIEFLLSFPVAGISKEPFCVILLEPGGLPEVDHALNDDGFQTFAESVIRQLSNALVLRDQAERLQHQAELTIAFFHEALDPYHCFNELARRVPAFLPVFGPLAITPPPEVQILLYDEVEEVLKIVGSTADDLPVTRVDTADSFTGELIRRPMMPYKVGNPNDDPEYKDYLGRAQSKRMLHELAVPIRWDGQTIGILNLESEHSSAFRGVHVESVRRLCANDGNPSIAPLVYALSNSIFLSNAQQLALTSALDKHLEHVSRTLRHGTATLAGTIGGNLRKVQTQISRGEFEVDDTLNRIRDDFEGVMKYVDSYRENIRRFSVLGRQSVRLLITSAIEMAPLAQLTKEHIKLRLIDGEDVEVYASLLLSQHLYDLIDNSRSAIKERLARDPRREGSIEILATLEPDPPAGQERDLNRRCRVTLRDNGIGVPPELLSRIGKPEVTTKGDGHGLGLFGLKRYVESIDGVWFPPQSKEGEFFEVSFLLDVYDDRIHSKGRQLTMGSTTVAE